MKNVFKRSGLAILCILMIISVLMSGCEKKVKTVSTNEPVKLKMILISDKPKNYDEIYGKLNEMLKKDINATVDIQWIPTGDVGKKYSLLFAGKEEFDLIYTSNTWCFYNDQAEKGGFYELSEEFIKKYAPKTFETMPKEAWKQATVKGGIYMIPNTDKEITNNVVCVRGDLREKYNLGKLDTVEDFYNYLYTIAKNEKGMIAYPNVNTRADQYLYKMPKIFGDAKNVIYGDVPVKGYRYAFNTDTNEIKTFCESDTKEYREMMIKAREMAENGVWPSDLISNPATTGMFENGKAATYASNVNTVEQTARRTMQMHPDWKVEMYQYVPESYVNSYSNYCANGMAIHATSKNPERALMLIELLRNDERYYNLTQYGIEGKHWKKGSKNGTYKDLNSTLADKDKYAPGCVWGWKNYDLKLVSEDDCPEKQQFMECWEKNIINNHAFVGFVPDSTNIDDMYSYKSAVSNADNVFQQYGMPLAYGMVEDVDKGIKEYRENLKKSGAEKAVNSWLKAAKAYINKNK